MEAVEQPMPEEQTEEGQVERMEGEGGPPGGAQGTAAPEDEGEASPSPEDHDDATQQQVADTLDTQEEDEARGDDGGAAGGLTREEMLERESGDEA